MLRRWRTARTDLRNSNGSGRYSLPASSTKFIGSCLSAVGTLRCRSASGSRAGCLFEHCQSSVTAYVKALERGLVISPLQRRDYSKNVALAEAERRVPEYTDPILPLAEKVKATVQNPVPPSATSRWFQATQPCVRRGRARADCRFSQARSDHDRLLSKG